MTAVQFAQKAVVTNKGGEVLLVRKSDEDPHNPGLWELPGGRYEGVEDVDAHVVREVLEETGLTVCPGRVIDLWSWNMSWHGEQVQVIAVSRYCTLTSTFTEEPHRELDDYLAEQRWFSPADLLALDIIPSQRPTIKTVVDDASLQCVPPSPPS